MGPGVLAGVIEVTASTLALSVRVRARCEPEKSVMFQKSVVDMKGNVSDTLCLGQGGGVKG